MLGRLGTHGASVTLAGRNLKTWTDYTGWDPETNAGAQRTLVRGFSFAATPIPSKRRAHLLYQLLREARRQ
jgi:hypothetical protein